MTKREPKAEPFDVRQSPDRRGWREKLILLKSDAGRHGPMRDKVGGAMQTPTQIEFEGVESSPELQAVIDQHMAELESRFGRVAAAGWIVVKLPSDYHQTGGQYQVCIRLALPDGREVNIGRTPNKDERYADLTFVIDNAFKSARRQLQDQARVMRGDVKQHAQSGAS